MSTRCPFTEADFRRMPEHLERMFREQFKDQIAQDERDRAEAVKANAEARQRREAREGAEREADRARVAASRAAERVEEDEKLVRAYLSRHRTATPEEARAILPRLRDEAAAEEDARLERLAETRIRRTYSW